MGKGEERGKEEQTGKRPPLWLTGLMVSGKHYRHDQLEKGDMEERERKVASIQVSPYLSTSLLILSP